jgi:FKBP-type peptidyl-prolyl cis-trans isomerase (trigger factor)
VVRLGLVLAEIDQKNNIKVTDEERVLPRSPG